MSHASRIQLLTDSVRGFYQSMDNHKRNIDCAGHWWDHVLRVVNNAALIMRNHAVIQNHELILAAALCHEIGYVEDKENHTRISFERCVEYMLNAGYDREIASTAARYILGTDRDIKIAETNEEKTLYIADKLDLFGYAGTIRLLIEHALQGQTVRHELAKIVAARQKDWYDYMISLSVSSDLVKERFDASLTLLNTLAEPSCDFFAIEGLDTQ